MVDDESEDSDPFRHCPISKTAWLELESISPRVSEAIWIDAEMSVAPVPGVIDLRMLTALWKSRVGPLVSSRAGVFEEMIETRSPISNWLIVSNKCSDS